MKTKAFKDRVLSLTDRIFPMMARLLGSKTKAEDATQEIMMKLWVKRKQIENHPNLSGFVFTMARNYCLDSIKKKKLDIISADHQLLHLEADMGHGDFEWRELKALVDTILEQLPEQQKEIMTMRDIDGMEFTEIAEVTQLKIEHIRVLLSRARKQVATALKKIEDYGY